MLWAQAQEFPWTAFFGFLAGVFGIFTTIFGIFAAADRRRVLIEKNQAEHRIREMEHYLRESKELIESREKATERLFKQSDAIITDLRAADAAKDAWYTERLTAIQESLIKERIEANIMRQQIAEMEKNGPSKNGNGS